MALAFTFRSIIHFELIFVYSVKVGPKFSLLHVALFVEKIIPSLLNCLYIFVESQSTVNVRVYSLILSSIPLIYMSILMFVPHCLHY